LLAFAVPAAIAWSARRGRPPLLSVEILARYAEAGGLTRLRDPLPGRVREGCSRRGVLRSAGNGSKFGLPWKRPVDQQPKCNRPILWQPPAARVRSNGARPSQRRNIRSGEGAPL